MVLAVATSHSMVSRLTLAKIGLVIGSWAAFYYGMLFLKSLQDQSVPPDVFDLATCERARLNAAKVLRGQTDLDSRAHRWTIEGCAARGFRTDR
ncbi:hypothetical protein MesoLjLc_50340 [Mesorhizobium sp. L-8-10]|uniref:hypothetical protein n=1 Tax=Mesorhizobium sp. L-8-10 TaxID=2744523 RepID=UPI00192652E8|nr:hypothetical protein [Mesorhizobium sp. L-8-10]BCH33104.1 hypothetical protein MesoLjLc_50340 [Mesorhizobium sp. L-8-10]